MKSVFELRKEMFDYMYDNYPVKYRVLNDWNKKMSLGIPLPQELWYDLFGKEVEKKLEARPIDHHTTDKRVLVISAGVWVNPDNPFEVVFCYKVIEALVEPVYFKMGDEDSLIKYCKERGCE